MQRNVNKCTLEDIDLTYKRMKELGTEELKNRLSALQEIKKSSEETNMAINKEPKALTQDSPWTTFDLKENRKRSEFLSLPRLIPTMRKVDRIAGYNDSPSMNEQLKKYPDQTQKKRGKSKKKHVRRLSQSNRKMCLNCQIETMNKTTWLPQIDDVKADGKMSRVPAEKQEFVLPAIKFSKYQ